MKQNKTFALIAILAITTLAGCNQSESAQTPQVTTKATETEQTTTTTVWDEWEPDEWDIESEPQREIRTSAETKEEVIALFLKAFYEKDTEVLSAFRCGNYDKMFNALCKALDEAGNLPEDIDEIDLDPKLFEVYRVTYSVIEDTWEASYSLADGDFTFSFKFSDYDYTNKAYSIKSIELLDHTVLRYYLSAYREYAASGEMLQGGSHIEAVDITPYLD